MIALNPPLLKIDDPLLEKTYESVFKELHRNLRAPSGYLKGMYAVPGGKYQKSWLWDTAFISQVWLLANHDVAKEIVLTHVMAQLKDGMIPHMVGPDYKSPITQPPLLAWAAWRIYERTQDEEFLWKVYPKLRLFNEWFYLNRDFNRDGLFSWIRSDESGWDDSPRFDGIKESQAPGLPRILRFPRALIGLSRYFPHPKLGNLDIRNIQALDLNCYLVVQMSSLAEMAETLNLSSDMKIFEKRINSLSERIRNCLWSQADTFFHDLGPDGFIKLRTPTAFLTLFAGVATKNQAKALVEEHLMSEKEFWTPYPIPTVAINDTKFSLRYWRGPVWVNINYMVYLGLKRYGYNELADKLRDSTIKMVSNLYVKRGQFFEFYNPFTGDVVDLQPPKPATHFVGWTGLIANLLVDKCSLL